MNIHIIWAQDNNGGIGKDNKLPWHISEDGVFDIFIIGGKMI